LFLLAPQAACRQAGIAPFVEDADALSVIPRTRAPERRRETDSRLRWNDGGNGSPRLDFLDLTASDEARELPRAGTAHIGVQLQILFKCFADGADFRIGQMFDADIVVARVHHGAN
jgi:hypothetical protein